MNEDYADAWAYLTTSVALITTAGPLGSNVMAAEWTMQVSYHPFLIATFIEPEDATHDQIVATGEFGANFCSEDQLALVAIAGGYTRRDVDKLTSEIFETYPARQIAASLIKGCIVNAECRVEVSYPLGDHTAFVGRVLEVHHDHDKRPMVRHCRRQYGLGEIIERPALIYVTVTPGTAAPGAVIHLVGRAFRPTTGEILLRVDGATPPVRGVGSLDDRGHFSTDLYLPRTMSPGRYRVIAEADDLVGSARLDVRPDSA